MSTTRGLVVGALASLAFGISGAFIKPLLEAGWSPAAAVTVRTGVAGLVLLPFALVALRGKWAAVARAKWRIIGIVTIGVAATQLLYYTAVQRVPVSTALLIEYLAPLLLVGFVWAKTRRMPRPAVMIGSVVAIGGLLLVIGPGSIVATDGLGMFFAALAAVGCATYYVIAARPSDGLPPVAFASLGLIGGSALLGLAGVTGVVRFTANFGVIPFLGSPQPWWLPLGVVALVGTAFAYVASIAASELLGSRLMSFVGLLEVVFASLFAWIAIDEALTPVQLVGGVLILAGIAFVRSERDATAELEPLPLPDVEPALLTGVEPVALPGAEPHREPVTTGQVPTGQIPTGQIPTVNEAV